MKVQQYRKEHKAPHYVSHQTTELSSSGLSVGGGLHASRITFLFGDTPTTFRIIEFGGQGFDMSGRNELA